MKTKFNSDADAELMDIIFDMNKLDLDIFYQELDIRREQWGLTWAQVQAQSKVSSTTRIRMAQGTEPSAEDMTKMRIWLREWPWRRSWFGLRAIDW